MERERERIRKCCGAQDTATTTRTCWQGVVEVIAMLVTCDQREADEGEDDDNVEGGTCEWRDPRTRRTPGEYGKLSIILYVNASSRQAARHNQPTWWPIYITISDLWAEIPDGSLPASAQLSIHASPPLAKPLSLGDSAEPAAGDGLVADWLTGLSRNYIESWLARFKKIKFFG